MGGMELDMIRAIYEYVRWADDRAIGAAEKLAPEAFTRPLGSSFASVRDTLVHAVSAEWIWLSRWTGTSPAAMWDPKDFPDAASLRRRWEEVQRDLAAFVARQTPETLRADCSYRNLKGQPMAYPLWKLMLHMPNHSTYHRGQVTTLLRQLGAEPVATDFVLWCGTRPA
jgi:uncharacterized damage-inducible protein DinB